MRVVILGSGGHARVCVEALLAAGIRPAGFVDRAMSRPTGIMRELQSFGTDDDLLAEAPDEYRLVNGVGSIGDATARRALFSRFLAAGFGFLNVVHPAAVIASDARIGSGSQIMAGAILQTGVVVGQNVIINTGACIDHDCRIADHVHVSPRVCMGGDVEVAEGAHIGIGASIIHRRSVGAGAIIAAGAVVIRDVEAGAVVGGVPAQQLTWSVGERCDARP